jgi:hypothetical protein
MNVLAGQVLFCELKLLLVVYEVVLLEALADA